MKKFFNPQNVLFTLILLMGLLVLISNYSHARQSASRLATPVFTDNGETRQHYLVNVGSMNASVQPFISDLRKDRVTLIQNPSSFELFIATWSIQNPYADACAFVPKSSGSLTVNMATFYMIYGNGVSSETVRITREQE